MLLGELCQGDEEGAKDYTKRTRELCNNMKKSLTIGVDGLTPTEAKSEVIEVQMQGVDHMVLRSYIAGYKLRIQ